MEVFACHLEREDIEKKRQEKKESVFVEACLLVFNSRQLVVKKRARKGLRAQANLAVIE
jgi:hypothetical protein